MNLVLEVIPLAEEIFVGLLQLLAFGFGESKEEAALVGIV